MESYKIRTRDRLEFVDITHHVSEFIEKNNIRDGCLLIYAPHTTAGITINENADPAVRKDMTLFIEKNYRNISGFSHMEGNSPAHILSSLFGISETVAVKQGKLLLGQWQGLFFCEFDGPRTRSFIVYTIA